MAFHRRSLSSGSFDNNLANQIQSRDNQEDIFDDDESLSNQDQRRFNFNVDVQPSLDGGAHLNARTLYKSMGHNFPIIDDIVDPSLQAADSTETVPIVAVKPDSPHPASLNLPNAFVPANPTDVTPVVVPPLPLSQPQQNTPPPVNPTPHTTPNLPPQLTPNVPPIQDEAGKCDNHLRIIYMLIAALISSLLLNLWYFLDRRKAKKGLKKRNFNTSISYFPATPFKPTHVYTNF